MPIYSSTSPTRRTLLAAAAASCWLLALGLTGAHAATTGATGFIQGFATDLVAIVNGPLPAEQKKQALAPVIERDVDVTKVARFCLGRFWASASPAQQQQYVDVFHKVLLNNISGHLGEYQGVTFALTGEHAQGENALVGTIINRPNAPAANVQWVVETSGGAMKVIDVVAEGTSLRLTQRSDYASYMGRHNNDISALLTALENQVAAGG